MNHQPEFTEMVQMGVEQLADLELLALNVALLTEQFPNEKHRYHAAATRAGWISNGTASHDVTEELVRLVPAELERRLPHKLGRRLPGKGEA